MCKYWTCLQHRSMKPLHGVLRSLNPKKIRLTCSYLPVWPALSQLHANEVVEILQWMLHITLCIDCACIGGARDRQATGAAPAYLHQTDPC